MSLDPKKASKEEIARGLELLQRENIRKEKIKKGEIKSYSWKDMSEEQKEKVRLANKRRRVRNNLEVARFKEAVANGICEAITDAEVEAAM